MKGGSPYRRALAATLAVVACVGMGCASTSSDEGPETESPAPPAQTAARQPSDLELTPQQERHAEALAHYAAGIAIEWNDGGVDAAVPEFVQALELDPAHTALAVRLAEIYLSHKDFAQADTLLQSSIKVDPSSADLWLLLGVTYRNSDQTPQAITALRQALKLDPKSLPALHAMLEIQLQQGPPADPVALLEHAFRQESKDPGYWMGLGDLYAFALKEKPSLLNLVDSNRSRQCYEKALLLSPVDPDILMRLADVCLDANDYKTAGDIYAKLFALRPDLPQLRERLAYTYIQADEKEKAIGVLDQMIQHDPSHFENYNMLGDLYDELDKEDKAVDNYRQSLVLNPSQIEVYVHITLAQLRLRKYEDALKTLAEAKEKFPTRYQIPYLYGLVYSDAKQYTNALTAFADAEQLAQESPDEPKLTSAFYFAYGSACERANNIDKAVPLFKKSIELDPENHAAYNYLGFMWADKGEHLDEALKLINKAVELDPNNGAYIDSLGWVLYKLDRYDEALPQLRRACQLITDDPTVFDHLAEDLMKLGKRDEAISVWRRALLVEPGNKDINGKLQKYAPDHTSAN